MHIRKRIKKIEADKDRNFDKWLTGLPDEELLKISGGGGDRFTGWLRTLTDGELELVRYDLPGAGRLMRKFDEYQKQDK